MNGYTIDDVTVVIIGRNEGANLPRCFESVQKATKQIVYVDSNSTDHSLEIAGRYQIPVIVRLESNFYSASLGRTAGAKKVTTRLIQFLDGDMELAEGWLGKAVEFMNRNPKAAVVHGYKKEYKTNLQDYKIKADTEDWRSDYLQGSYLISRSVYELAGGLDPRFSGEEERDLYVRIDKAGSEVWYHHALMASHYDFKARGWKYLFFSDVAGAVMVPFVKYVLSDKFMSYMYVYRRMLPVLAIDLASILALLSLTIAGLATAVVLQIAAFFYTAVIKRPGYFIIWKSALFNIHRTIRIMRRRIHCVPVVVDASHLSKA